MATITYCKGLPTPIEEMNSLGFTEMEMFLDSFAPVFRDAVCETVNFLLLGGEFNKSKWNTHLQQKCGISKRHANGVISYSKGLVDSAKECRTNHIKTLAGKANSIETAIKGIDNKVKSGRKFYAKKNWQNSKTGCSLYLSCNLQTRKTNWHGLKFERHQKLRRLHRIKQQIEHLKTAPIKVKIPRNQIFVVGSKDESFGNQTCQWDGLDLNFRAPACLEPKFGKYVKSRIGGFERKNSRLPATGAKTWHFYRKHGKWCVAVQFTPAPVQRVSRDLAYACIGIDMNPGSIGWAYCDGDGNLKARGKIPLQMGLPSGKQDAQIVDACLQLAALANVFACPVVCEELDFSTKKQGLRERSNKYARMLSGWAYSRFYELLDSILSNRGISLLKVNPAYSSVIGLVKYVRMYGLASDEAAALVIARRAMRLGEKIPRSINAYLSVKDGKHVWSKWGKLNKLTKKSSIRRHDYYAISNWESLVNQVDREVDLEAV
ncbi:MAG: hypothetical protein WBV73_22275 [Phormidium sp.]